MILRYSIRAGGAEEAVNPHFDLESAMHRERMYAYVKLVRELEARGLLQFSERVKDGDYTHQYMTLELPDEVKQ